MQATKTEIQYPTESNRGYYFKIRVGIKHHGTKKKHEKNEITPTRSNKIRLQPKTNVSLRIWNGAVGWLWRLDSMIHPSSQFCWGKWWWNNDETSNVRVFPYHCYMQLTNLRSRFRTSIWMCLCESKTNSGRTFRWSSSRFLHNS